MNKRFISINPNIKSPFKSTSLLLRRPFNINDINHKFYLEAIGLGVAVYYLNGQRITDSVLNTTNSDYSKTLFLDRFDVTNLIRKGRNVIAIELGNGFYNESLETVWKINHAHWRGEKCLYLKIKADHHSLIKSDERFKVTYSPYMAYNELRAGECFDQRKFVEFYLPDYDDSNWDNAVFIEKEPTGKIKENLCPLIKEFAHLSPINIIKSNKGYIFDFGRNISGYITAKINAPIDRQIIFKHAEDISNNELELHGLNCYQKDEPFQTDICISNGQPFIYKPRFTYHGFRYVEVIGIDSEKDISIEAIFVHQDIKYLRPQKTLNEMYQKIFDAGINSILSNIYYGFTDCPTREKLNWLNDLSATLPVILKYFDAKELLAKVYQDIIDSQDSSGNVPGIAPSPDWGYEHGPVCNNLLITLPYEFYKQYHDRSLFDNNISHIKKYYRFIKKNLNSNYFVLGDWTGATNHPKTPIKFILETYMYIFDKILYEMTNSQIYLKDLMIREKHLLSYKIEGQTIPSVLLCLGIGNSGVILNALIKDIEINDYHFDMGMFGFQYLFKALSENKRDDIIHKIVCNEKAPSFKLWIDNGATTLYETFGETWSLSMNHHMFSCVILYLK